MTVTVVIGSRTNVPPAEVTENPVARLPSVFALLRPEFWPPTASGVPRVRVNADPTTFVGLIPSPNVSPAEVRLIGFVVAVAVVTFPLKFCVSALLLAWDLLDYPLGMHRVDVPARLAFFKHNFWGLFVFGAFGAIILLVPGLGLLLLPFGVAGATRLVMKAKR